MKLLALAFLQCLICLIAKANRTNSNNNNKLEEIIFDRASFILPTIQHKKSPESPSQNERDLDQTIQNMLQIDTLSKESLKQFELINDCTTRLSTLEAELDLVTAQVSDITKISKTPRYAAASAKTAKANTNVGRVTYNLVQNAKQQEVNSPRPRTPLPTSSAARSSFFHSQTMQDIRNHFINHLK
jgi:hypothetical protein